MVMRNSTKRANAELRIKTEDLRQNVCFLLKYPVNELSLDDRPRPNSKLPSSKT